MTEDILNILLKSGKASISEDWDALYQDDLPIVVAPSTAELDEATGRLDAVGGYGYIATWKKNLFSFNPKLLSKRCGLICLLYTSPSPRDDISSRMPSSA